jgi:large subunit ribosomal protein L25
MICHLGYTGPEEALNMERMELEAEVRIPLSKGKRRELRREDKILAVLYGRGKETQPLLVEGRALRQVLSTGGGNVLVDLTIKEKGKKAKQETVMFKDTQRYLLQKEKLMHVDFIRISMTDKVEVNIQLNFTGDPVGVKEGGVLQLLTREVAVKCLPGDIPERIDVDLSNLAIGESVTAGSLQFDREVELVTAPDELLAQVLAPTAEEGPAAEEAAEEEAEAAGKADEEALRPAE